MGELRMYAIAIDDLRDMFGAEQSLAGRLRRIASEAFRPETPPRQPMGLLGRIGPVFRTPADAPMVPHGTPLPSDVETLLAGRFVSPERLPEAWRVVDAWLSAECLARHQLDRTAHQVEELEFELTRAGLPSPYGIGKLMAHDAQIPLRPAPGMRVGYCKHAHAVASGRALQSVLPEVLPHSRERATCLANFLLSFDELARHARREGRAQPDLFVSFDQR